MADTPSKKNPFLEYDKVYASAEIEALFYPSDSDSVLKSEKDDDKGGEGGGDAGVATLSVEALSAYLRALFNKERRERIDGQKKFGICPYSKNPNDLLNEICSSGGAIKRHPLLIKTQYFDGISPSITAHPPDNSEARERFLEKRLENHKRLLKRLGLGASKTVTLAR